MTQKEIYMKKLNNKLNNFKNLNNVRATLREEVEEATQENKEVEISLDELLQAYGDKSSASVMLPEPELLDYYEQLENREILWNDEIDESLLFYIKHIVDWNKEDDENNIPISERKVIKVKINTNGGCLNSIMSFLMICNLSKTPISTIGFGKCDSAGALLLMGGTKGYRYVLPTTECLIHDGSNGVVNTTAKLQDYLKFNEKIEKQVKDFVINNSNITSELYDNIYRADYWLLGEEIVELGIADKIIDDISMLY